MSKASESRSPVAAKRALLSVAICLLVVGLVYAVLARWDRGVAGLIDPNRGQAALRKIEARSCHGMRDQSACASSAALIARSTSALRHLCQCPSTWPWSCGITASAVRLVRTLRPPIRAGISMTFPAILSSWA